MMKKRIWIIGISIFVLFICVVGGRTLKKYVEEHNTKIEKSILKYRQIASKEREWIRDCQLSSGALLMYGKEDEAKLVSINPYFANIAIEGLLSGNPSKEDTQVAKKYMEWYFRHLNKTEDDLINGAGTIYDYKVQYKENGTIEEICLNSYDSADAYAGTFLHIVARYMELTEDKEWFLSWRQGIFSVSDALLRCAGKKDVFANNWKSEVSYSMDNCEAFAGIIAISPRLKKLAATDGQIEIARKMKEAKDHALENFQKAFWSKENNRFEIGFDKVEQYIDFSDPDRIYPELVCLIFPQAWGLTQDKAQGKKMYQKVSELISWESLNFYKSESNSCWPVFAFVGALNEDTEAVEKYISGYGKIIDAGRGYPLHVDESGWVIQTCEKMIEQIDKHKIKFPWE